MPDNPAFIDFFERTVKFGKIQTAPQERSKSKWNFTVLGVHEYVKINEKHFTYEFSKANTLPIQSWMGRYGNQTQTLVQKSERTRQKMS